MGGEASAAAVAWPETVWRLWSNAAQWPSWNPSGAAIALGGPIVEGATRIEMTGPLAARWNIAGPRPQADATGRRRHPGAASRRGG